MPDPVDLSYAIGLPPEDAINYFRQKGYTFSWNWHDVWQDAHAKSFTVAKAMKLDLLQDIRGAVDKALANGTTLATFRDELEPLLKAKGWWGKDADTGAQLGSPHRLETIFRTNLQSSYMAGRYKQQVENADDRPYWQYIAVMDSRTRPAHSALNGKVFRFDDVFWNTHFPPCGYRCRCRTRAYTEKQVKDKGLTVESGADNMVWEDKKISGDITRPVAGYKDPKTGNVTFTDPGWSSNPGKEHWKPDFGKILEKMNPPKKWEYIPGTQGGSNPGGIFMSPDGKKFYGKVYDNVDQAKFEHLSYRIMDKLNIGGAKTILKELEWNGRNRTVLLSEWMDNAVPLNRYVNGAFTATDKKQLIKQYLNASLTNNWDFVGMNFENIVKVGNKWYQIDAGGSFTFRAMGGNKAFTGIAESFETMLGHGMNPARVYSQFLKQTLSESGEDYIKWLKGLTDRKIKALVSEAGVDSSFAEILSARRNDLIQRIERLSTKVVSSEQDKIDNGLIKQFLGDSYDRYKRAFMPGYSELTETEFIITKAYTGSFYGRINRTLVQNAGEYYPGYEIVPSDQIIAIERQINNALDKLPKTSQNTVWRGVDFEDISFVESKFKKGATVTMPGFQSTSVNPDRAFNYNVKFTIKLKSKQGGMVESFSDVRSEEEFLMKSGLRFKVLSRTKYEGNRYLIELEEI